MAADSHVGFDLSNDRRTLTMCNCWRQFFPQISIWSDL